MTLVRVHGKPGFTGFNNIMESLSSPYSSLYKQDPSFSLNYRTPVNIKETETGFELELIAPGYDKQDFKINLDKNILSISAEKKNDINPVADKYIRKEYTNQSLERSFTVEETIDAEKISAKYVNGVLLLNLPKKAVVKEEVKQINIQ
jgi:HSP20 family protein